MCLLKAAWRNTGENVQTKHADMMAYLTKVRPVSGGDQYENCPQPILYESEQ
jgi:hypothetical protein